MRRCALIVLLASLVGAPTAAGAGWRWPVHGRVVARFAYREATPFAAGQHRGIEIAAAPGTVVRSACGGRVGFAGTISGSDAVVSVACDDGLNASYLQLGELAAGRGDWVSRGERIGSVGPGARLRFGVRRRGRRWAYVDPLSVLPGEGGPRSTPPAPPRSRPHDPPLGPAPDGELSPRRVPAPSNPTSPALTGRASPARVPDGARATGLPLAAWLGFGLLAVALPGLGLRRTARRRRARDPVAVRAQAGLRPG